MAHSSSQNEPDYINQEYIGPILTIRDGRGLEAVAFYKAAFGAREPEAGFLMHEDGKRIRNAHMSVCGGELLLTDEFPEENGDIRQGEPSCITMHLQVADADVTWARAMAAGAEPLMPLANMPWGYRLGHLRDPFGFIWSLGSRKLA